jgi:SpoVK/Ycf46/Vps4 family AAA+-type ATPase
MAANLLPPPETPNLPEGSVSEVSEGGVACGGVIESIASKAHGFVGGDLLLLCKEAALEAMRRRVRQLDRTSLFLALYDVDVEGWQLLGGLMGCPLPHGSWTYLAPSPLWLMQEGQEEVRLCADDLRVALTRVRPSALREVTVEVRTRCTFSTIESNHLIRDDWLLK